MRLLIAFFLLFICFMFSFCKGYNNSDDIKIMNLTFFKQDSILIELMNTTNRKIKLNIDEQPNILINDSSSLKIDVFIQVIPMCNKLKNKIPVIESDMPPIELMNYKKSKTDEVNSKSKIRFNIDPRENKIVKFKFKKDYTTYLLFSQVNVNDENNWNFYIKFYENNKVHILFKKMSDDEIKQFIKLFAKN